jgi:Cation transporter/ATPase, N-terminus
MSKANADPTAEGITWHAMGADEVERRLTTDIEKGLDAGEASSRLQKYGPNRLPEGKKRGPFMRLALAQLQAASVCRIDAAQAKALALGHAEWVDVFLDAVENFSSWHGAAPVPALTLVGCKAREMIAVFRKASQGSDRHSCRLQHLQASVAQWRIVGSARWPYWTGGPCG